MWVNHIDIENDRRLVATLPGRTGYVMHWTPECEVELLRLADLAPSTVPPGMQRWPPGG